MNEVWGKVASSANWDGSAGGGAGAGSGTGSGTGGGGGGAGSAGGTIWMVGRVATVATLHL